MGRMSKPGTTLKQQLLEDVYPGDLPADVRAMRQLGMAWRPIAEHVSRKARVNISHTRVLCSLSSSVSNRKETETA